MLLHKSRALHEHTTGTAGGVEHAAVIGLQDLHDQANDAARREELAALLPFRARELAEEIFVDPAEGVVIKRVENLGNFFEQLFDSG